MADQSGFPPGWEELEPGFYVNTFTPEGRGNPDDGRFDVPFNVTFVSVKTNSDLGREWNNDPLAVLSRVDPEGRRFEIPDFEKKKPGTDRPDVHIFTVRVNAELPANPKYGRSLVSGFGGSSRILIVHFKDDRDFPEVPGA
jgi:hypothetical protein